MSRIKINKIKETTAELYGPRGGHIGTITSELQLNDIRIQIMKQNLSGYYIIWENRQIFINRDGRLHEWPVGFFDIEENQLYTLMECEKEV